MPILIGAQGHDLHPLEHTNTSIEKSWDILASSKMIIKTQVP
jgi:hypothetical protein